jgi:hypothetical protein
MAVDVKVIFSRGGLGQGRHVAIGAESTLGLHVRDMPFQILLLLVADETAVVAHPAGLVGRLPLTVGDVTENATHPGRMGALLPVQIFLVVSLGGTIGPEVFLTGGCDEDIV